MVHSMVSMAKVFPKQLKKILVSIEWNAQFLNTKLPPNRPYIGRGLKFMCEISSFILGVYIISGILSKIKNILSCSGFFIQTTEYGG